jgi:hypothetical protein
LSSPHHLVGEHAVFDLGVVPVQGLEKLEPVPFSKATWFLTCRIDVRTRRMIGRMPSAQPAGYHGRQLGEFVALLQEPSAVTNSPPPDAH